MKTISRKGAVMVSIEDGKRFLHAGAFVFGMMLHVMPGAQAAPAVTVSTSLNQQILTVSLTASAFPQLRSITFDCTYDPRGIAIMDAVVGSSLAATALGVAVDTAAHTLRLMITAASVVAVADGKPLLTLHIPARSQEAGNSFTVSKAVITDKNGTTVNAVIHGTAVELSSWGLASFPLTVRNAGNTMELQLNGRRLCSERGEGVPGCVIRRFSGAAASRMIFMR